MQALQFKAWAVVRVADAQRPPVEMLNGLPVEQKYRSAVVLDDGVALTLSPGTDSGASPVQEDSDSDFMGAVGEHFRQPL
ncbi:MAG: hypothetical protein AB7I48_27235, partial [Planctomycetaceae bacterium]